MSSSRCRCCCKDDIAFPTIIQAWAEADIFGFTDELLWQSNVDHAAADDVNWRGCRRWRWRCCWRAWSLLSRDRVSVNRRRLWRCFVCIRSELAGARSHRWHRSGRDVVHVQRVWMWTVALETRSRWRRAVIAGLLAGAALSTKYSAVMACADPRVDYVDCIRACAINC